MQSSSIPPKFQIPWANSAGGANVRTIPTASQISIQAGAASLTDGFPPLNFVPVSAGGVPPFGQDMNGVLKQTTQWLQWYAAGGAVRYDGTFVSSIGGYPAGALIMSNTGHAIYENLVENNFIDPNISTTNWRIVSCVWSATTWIANGSANAQTITLTPAPTSLNQLSGIPLRIFSQGTNTSATTLNVNNLGAVSIVVPGGVPLASGSLLTGSPFEVVLQGVTPFTLMSRTNTFYDNASGGLVVQGPNSNGANIALLGNGGSTPNKFIRALNGAFQIVNSAYNAVICTISDIGDTTLSGNVTAGTRLRSLGGSTGTGDQNAAPILADFASGSNATGWWFTIPTLGLGSSNSVMVQGGSINAPGNNSGFIYPLPRPFNELFLGMTISFGGAVPPTQGAVGAQPSGLSNFLAVNSSTLGGTNGCLYLAVGF